MVSRGSVRQGKNHEELRQPLMMDTWRASHELELIPDQILLFIGADLRCLFHLAFFQTSITDIEVMAVKPCSHQRNLGLLEYRLGHSGNPQNETIINQVMSLLDLTEARNQAIS